MLLALDSISDALSESFPSHTSGAESKAESLDFSVDVVEVESVVAEPKETGSSHTLLVFISNSFRLLSGSENLNERSESEHSLYAG